MRLYPWNYLAAAMFFVAVPTWAIAQTPCRIDAPDDVEFNERFTLCGPDGSGYEYEWYGPGVDVDNHMKCVTAKVRVTGSQEYVLVISRNGRELTRCRKVVNVGGATGTAESCEITGPNTIRYGERVRLCSPDDGKHTYAWRGPGGFTSSAPCITVTEEGTYFLSSRNRITGTTRQCTHRLSLASGRDDNCDISGPNEIPERGSVQLCAPTGKDTYRWEGPRDFSSVSRCITVRVPGTYTVYYSRFGQDEDQCSRTLTMAGGAEVPGDRGRGNRGRGPRGWPRDTGVDNCPRDVSFWADAFRYQGRGGPFRQAQLVEIARMIDDRSRYFQWGNDVRGVRDALNPRGSLTRRKQAVREFATLLANLAARELELNERSGELIGIEWDTRVTLPGVDSIRGLVQRADRAFSGERGDYRPLYSAMRAINDGEGIGPTCVDEEDR